MPFLLMGKGKIQLHTCITLQNKVIISDQYTDITRFLTYRGLRQSERPDIVNIISSAAHPLTHDCEGHTAFYATKAGQERMAETLSLRLRKERIRVISLYPPDFDNSDPLINDSQISRTSKDRLTSESLIDCIQFAVNMPRDCFIHRFDIESV